jgi:hypothetical protein
MSLIILHLEFVEKPTVILIDLPLYVTCLFTFAAFSILSLFCLLCVLITICLGGNSFSILTIWYSVSLLNLDDSLSRGQGSFQLLFIE